MKRGGGFLASLVCIYFFYVIVVNQADPYFAYDSLVTNIVGFADMSSTVAKCITNFSRFTKIVREVSIGVFDFIFTWDVNSFSELLKDALGLEVFVGG